MIGPGLGRYVNDGVASEANCGMQVMLGTPKEAPRLALYATRKLTKREELRYIYGVPNLPWRVIQYRNSQKLCEPGESSPSKLLMKLLLTTVLKLLTATDDHCIHEQAVTEAAVNQSM